MTDQVPTFQPNTAICCLAGYSLYSHDGKPWVVHAFKRRRKVNGEVEVQEQVEHLSLDGFDGWGDGKRALETRAVMKREWAAWQGWNSAMKGEA